MATLEDEIRDLKVEIAGYRQDYATANTLGEKKMYADLITASRNNLHDLFQQQQQAQAGGGQGTQGGGGGQAQGDATTKLVGLLRELDEEFSPNEAVLARIRQSAYYSTRLLAAATAEDAQLLYEHALRRPQTTTCVRVQEDENVSIGDVVHMEGSQATFLAAFEGVDAKILKIPMESDKVGAECRFYEKVYRPSEGFSEDVPLVPVRTITFRDDASVQSQFSPMKKAFNRGILMPKYLSSLCENPIPISAEIAVMVGNRIFLALTEMHRFKYLHADVKPGNIFFDHRGAWLGDYGSSVHFSMVGKFVGGTARYQCAEVPPTATVMFDYMGLALTLLEKTGLMALRNGFMSSLDTVRCAISEVSNDEFRNLLKKLVPDKDGEDAKV